MKKLLTIIAVLLCYNTIAQSIVNDTVVVRPPFTASRSGGTSRDTLLIPAATTTQNGFATAASLSNIANLQTDVTTLNNTIGGLNTDVTNAGTPKGTRDVLNTTYTIVPDDNGRVLFVNHPISSATITITVPTGLPDGFTCDILASRGNVVMSPATGVTLNSPLGYRKSQTPNAYIVLRVFSNNVAALTGNLKQ